MKKFITFSILFLAYQLNLISQIQFKIESPASIAGNFGFTTTADPGVSPAGWTATPDLNDTANAVMDTLMFVEDGTTGINPQGNPISQEGCFPLINDLTGKIAVVWRNTCQFGEKILNAEKAGAVGVVIINREPGLVNMAPADSGALCTIPAVFVDSADGAIIANEMANGPVVAFMGTLPPTVSYITACDSYTWINGNTYTNSTASPTFTYTNASGVDSVVSLNLTINYSSSGIDSIFSCNPYTWIDGITYTSSNNTATHTLTNAAGCDSIVTLNFTISSLSNVDFSSNVSSFTSAPFLVEFSNTTPNISDYNFTWDFGDDSTLQSNNSIVFHEYQYNGLYDVMLISENILTGCVDTMLKTDNIYCTGGPGLSIIEVSNNINVFPNPTNENITISVSNYNGNIKTEVYDLIGNKLQISNETTINLSDYVRGIYLLQVAYGDRVEEVKVIKD